MKAKSRFTAIVLVVVLCLSLCACGGQGGASSKDFSIGTSADGAYSNSFFGLKIRLDSDWMFATESELLSLSNSAGMDLDTLDSQAVKTSLESGTLYYDMYAVSSDGRNNVNAMIRDVRKGFGDDLTVESVVEQGITELEQTYRSMGYGDGMVVKQDTVSFLGSRTPCVHATLHVDNISTYQAQVYIIHDGYLEFITATSYLKDNTKDILAKFEKA